MLADTLQGTRQTSQHRIMQPKCRETNAVSHTQQGLGLHQRGVQGSRAVTRMERKMGVLGEEKKTQVRSLGGEDPLEEEMATHSSTLAWRIPGTEEHSGLQFHGAVKSWTCMSD